MNESEIFTLCIQIIIQWHEELPNEVVVEAIWCQIGVN